MPTRSALGLSLAIAIAAPLSALAQDWTPINDRILSDPTFLPLKGQFYGETSYGYERTNDHNYDPSGAELSQVRHTLNTIRQTFEFGITDQLSLDLSDAYGFSGQARTTDAAGVSTQGVSGFENPTFGLTYRVFDQRSISGDRRRLRTLHAGCLHLEDRHADRGRQRRPGRPAGRFRSGPGARDTVLHHSGSGDGEL